MQPTTHSSIWIDPDFLPAVHLYVLSAAQAREGVLGSYSSHQGGVLHPPIYITSTVSLRVQLAPSAGRCAPLVFPGVRAKLHIVYLRQEL